MHYREFGNSDLLQGGHPHERDIDVRIVSLAQVLSNSQWRECFKKYFLANIQNLKDAISEDGFFQTWKNNPELFQIFSLIRSSYLQIANFSDTAQLVQVSPFKMRFEEVMSSSGPYLHAQSRFPYRELFLVSGERRLIDLSEFTRERFLEVFVRRNPVEELHIFLAEIQENLFSNQIRWWARFDPNQSLDNDFFEIIWGPKNWYEKQIYRFFG